MSPWISSSLPRRFFASGALADFQIVLAIVRADIGFAPDRQIAALIVVARARNGDLVELRMLSAARAWTHNRRRIVR